MSEQWHGSDHGYGAIGIGDARFLEGFLERVKTRFGDRLKILEVGIANGYTGAGMVRYLNRLGACVEYHGIDGPGGAPHDGVLPVGGVFHQGDSTEIFESVPDGFHFVLIDACHCSNHCALDFLNYGTKAVVGGIVIFHDTNPNPKWQGQFHQGHGPKTPAFGIGTRSAMAKLGLLNGHRSDWRLIAEEADGDMLGMTAFERIK